VRLAAAAVIALAAAGWVALLVAAPRLISSADGDAAVASAAWAYRAGALVCHQQAGRSFARGGVPLPVCARCTGLYAGGAGGALLAWLAVAAARRRPLALSLLRWRWLTGVSALPLLAAWTVEHVLGLGVTNLARFTTALPLGAVAAMVVVIWAGGGRFDDSGAATAIH
jgi:uncharacterized membrane protein